MFDLDQLKLETVRLESTMHAALGVRLNSETRGTVYRAALGETRSQLYEVAQLFAAEADKGRNAGGYFSATLMIASAIETLLALTCLLSEKEVARSGAYRSLKGKKKRNFEEKILSAFFSDLIEIAIDLNWIVSSDLDQTVINAVKTDMPVFADGIYPSDSAEERMLRIERLDTNPGVEMLSVLQDIRNLIHGPRWPRLSIKADPVAFEDNCKFAFVVSYQVMMCLFGTITRKAFAGIEDVKAMLQDMPPQLQDLVMSMASERLGFKL